MTRFLRLLCLASGSVLLCAFGASPDQSKGDERKPKESDAAIARLVEQLGSPSFAEREQATKDLGTIGVLALDALRKAAKSTNPEVARRATRLWETIDLLDLLLADYRSYGLPLPPENAKLVRFDSGVREYHGFTLMPRTYFLGFLLCPGNKDNPPLLLVGTQEYRLESHERVEFPEPKPELVKSIYGGWCCGPTFLLNTWLVVALQCKARGWSELAQVLWTSGLKKDSGHSRGLFYHPENLPNRTAVAYLAWVYSGNELVKPDTDRAKTAKRMKSLLAAEPQLNTEDNRALLTSLEAALVPSKTKPGTVERMIDDLTEMSDRWHTDDPRYLRLAQMGFDAVPSLIEHLNDERLTRSINGGINNWATYILRVNEVISHILHDMAGGELGEPGAIRAWRIEKAAAQAWWDKARKEGGEAYVLSHVLPPGDKVEGPNSIMLGIIEKKWPRHLPKLYEMVLDERPKVLSQDIAEAVAKSSLADQKKRELFLHACRRKNLEHRRFGLTHLQKFDPQEFITILLATLDNLPKTPAEPSASWESNEAGFAHLVSATDDVRAWKMLEKVAKRSDVGLRMEYIYTVGERGLGDHQRKLCLEFLKAFLDDPAKPNLLANPKSFNGPQLFFMFEQLDVRSMAAMRIATILGKPVQLNRNLTPEQMKKLGDQMKELMEKLTK